ncbi:MAG: hypothetical protein KKC26_03615 [Nanoarchaeota archaeon]|nr:hypothetical protein [Nanoarchaeota archaeon]
MAKKNLATKKIKKKKWYPIIAPKIFNEKVIGESLLAESSAMEGRYITMNLINILGDPKKQNTNIQFKITKVVDGKGYTTPVKFELLPSFIKRLVKRGKEKVSDSFLAKTADNKIVRVKPLFITNSNTHKSVLSNLRISGRKLIREKLAKSPFDNVVSELVNYQFQKDVRASLSKIYPLKAAEMRVLKIELNKADMKLPEVKLEEVAEVVGEESAEEEVEDDALEEATKGDVPEEVTEEKAVPVKEKSKPSKESVKLVEEDKKEADKK